MAQSSSAAHQVASRYATALIDTAQDAGALDSVARDMNELAAMIGQSDDLSKLVTSPVFGRAQSQSAIGAITQSASFNILTSNFLQVLAVNGRLMIVKNIISAFQDELARRRGEVKAQVVSAYPLTGEQQNNLKQALGGNVTLDMSVDRALLGGMVVTIGSRMIDDSVRSKLDRLKQNLQTSNQNSNNLKEVG